MTRIIQAGASKIHSGIDPVGSPFGIRFNAGYARYAPHDYVSSVLDNAQTFNGDADLKVRMLSGHPCGMHVQLYGIGGFSFNRYKNILENNHGVYNIGTISGHGDVRSTSDDAWHSGYGFNAGAGVQIGHGVTNLFVESRYTQFSGEEFTHYQCPDRHRNELVLNDF